MNGINFDPHATALAGACHALANAGSACCLGSCPPEDIGGTPGYEEFREAIRDSKHPQHEAMLQRCGSAFDPGAFDPMHAQERLNAINI